MTTTLERILENALIGKKIRYEEIWSASNKTIFEGEVENFSIEYQCEDMFYHITIKDELGKLVTFNVAPTADFEILN